MTKLITYFEFLILICINSKNLGIFIKNDFDEMKIFNLIFKLSFNFLLLLIN